jgi:hypothetical protein
VRSLTPGILNIGYNTAGPMWAGYFFALVRSRRGFLMPGHITPYASIWAALARLGALLPDGTRKARISHAVKPDTLAPAEKSPKSFILLKRWSANMVKDSKNRPKSFPF